MNVTQFCEKHRIRSSTIMVDENPNCPEWTDADHWKVTLRGFDRQLTVYFSKGSGHHGAEPEVDEVLDCLMSDDTHGQSFEDWASELGYDTDSRKAERIYHACQKNTEKLRKFLNGHYDELAEAERL